ncbi:MAG: metal-dependent transcriptional regulator [Bacilli bacterium]|nr:metal-dependent transcriptional regulator [Bacilli bacterium]
MKIYESAEDYLERILMLKKQNGKVISLDIAISMNYSKASVSRAIKNLKENNYITVDSKGEINLTERGLIIAERMYTRHTLLSDFFVSLGVDPDIAKNDACKVEHGLSDETFNAIKKLIENYKK